MMSYAFWFVVFFWFSVVGLSMFLIQYYFDEVILTRKERGGDD